VSYSKCAKGELVVDWSRFLLADAKQTVHNTECTSVNLLLNCLFFDLLYKC